MCRLNLPVENPTGRFYYSKTSTHDYKRVDAAMRCVEHRWWVIQRFKKVFSVDSVANILRLIEQTHRRQGTVIEIEQCLILPIIPGCRAGSQPLPGTAVHVASHHMMPSPRPLGISRIIFMMSASILACPSGENG